MFRVGCPADALDDSNYCEAHRPQLLIDQGEAPSLHAQVVIGIVVAAIVLWFLPALNQWIKHRMAIAPVQTSALVSADTELARRYAAVLAACFNGQRITDGTLVIECRGVER